MTQQSINRQDGEAVAETSGPIYLDYQATTPTYPRAVEAMLPYFSERFGNPHSTQHSFGRFTLGSEIDWVAGAIIETVRRLRASCVWAAE